MGFAIPIRDWLNGPLRDMIRDLILGQSFLSRGIVSPSFVQHLLREHETGRRDNQTWLWSLLVLAMWLEDTRNARASPSHLPSRLPGRSEPDQQSLTEG